MIGCALILSASMLRVSGNTHALELAPVLAAERALGQSAVGVSDGGINSLLDSGADVAVGSEIQTLRASVAHPDLRVIFTVAEGPYRDGSREIFNLDTTAAKLADPDKRRQIVAFVGAVISASKEIRPDGSRQMAYRATLVHDLPDVMAAEDVGFSREESRAPRTRAELVSLVDPTVRLDALALLKQQSEAARGDTRAGNLTDTRERIERLGVGVGNSEAIRAVKRLLNAYAQ